MATEDKLVGKCNVCEINVYDFGNKNKPFMHLGKQRMGFPRAVAMPCGVNRDPNILAELKKLGFSPEKEVSASQQMRCPFETKREQDEIDYQKGKGIFSGNNNWEGIT